MNTEILIPEYTADDFRNSSEPYSFIQEYANDPFIQRQLLSKLKAHAASMGVRDFMSIWKAYQNSLKIQSNAIIENATDFPEQPIELQCNKYTCDMSGVKMQDVFGGETVICAHPILPVSRLVNVDDNCERLELAYYRGGYWRYLIAEKSMLASSNGILQLAAQGVHVNSENAKILSSYIFDLESWNYNAIPECKSVSRLGWVGQHGFSPYYEGLTFDGETNFKRIFDAIKANGDYEEWKKIMRKLRAEKTPARIALAASFASVLLEPCGLLSFYVHFWGGQGSGKTAGCLKTAASVWGSPKMGDLISTFNSTDVGQEMTASFLNSLPMCIDELQISVAAGSKDFDRQIYKLTEGVGRTRAKKDGGLRRTSTWHNCMITTGEQPIINANSMGGASVRVIECECSSATFSDLRRLCDIVDCNYGFAGHEFVEYLQSEGAMERVIGIQRDFYSKLIECDGAEKQAASASAILAADFIATELIFKDGNALTVEDISKIMTKKSEIDVNARALEYISELVVTNSAKFALNASDEGKLETWGRLDGNKVYILKSVFDREMSNGGFNSTSFLSWAKSKERIVCDDNKRTKKTRVNRKTVNCVCLILDDEEPTVASLDTYGEDDLPY